MCVYACQFPVKIRHPCAECQAEWIEDMEAKWEVDKLARADLASQAVPATDREWSDYLDQVAPVVTVANPFTFTRFASIALTQEDSDHETS